MKDNTWQQVKKILCVRLDNMGDVIMTSPAIRALQQTFSHASITLLTSSKGSTITPFLSMIHRTIICNVPWMKHVYEENNLLPLIQQLQEEYFDAGICFTNFSQSCLPEAMLLFLARIPLRLGYCRENPHGLLTDWIIDTEPFEEIKHGVIRQLDLVKHIGATTDTNNFSLLNYRKEIAHIESVLKENGIDIRKPFIVVHPGASDTKRRFPVDILGPAVRELTKKYQIILTGIPEEKPLVDELAFYTPNAISLCGTLSIGEYIALLSKGQLLLSNNTGPVHIASAVNTPVVVLYARTNPEHTPWKIPYKILYFDNPDNQTKNQILRLVRPKEAIKPVTSLDIVLATERLLEETALAKKFTYV